MKEEFEKLAAAGKIEGRHVAALTVLADAGCCIHRSWGFGRIKAVDPVFARFTIDFHGKPGHPMDLAFAAESLKPISKDHILARKTMDPEGVRRLAARHIELVKIVINSYGGRATADQIQQVLVPDVINADWKKWWEVARREMKKDGHFIVPTKKTEPVIYQAKETSLQDRLLAGFPRRQGPQGPRGGGVRNPQGVARSQGQKGGGHRSHRGAESRNRARTSAPSRRWRWRRFSPATNCGRRRDWPPADGEVTAAQVWLQDGIKFGPLLETIPAAKHHRALESYKQANPGTW